MKGIFLKSNENARENGKFISANINGHIMLVIVYTWRSAVRGGMGGEPHVSVYTVHGMYLILSVVVLRRSLLLFFMFGNRFYNWALTFLKISSTKVLTASSW
jgi:hypothetical protein